MQADDIKALEILENRLKSCRETISKALRDDEIIVHDSDMLKFNAHGQWSLMQKQEDPPPYWSPKAMGQHRRKFKEQERASRVNRPAAAKPGPVPGVAPSVETPYVNIPGPGRGKDKVFKESAGSLHGDHLSTVL